MKTVNTFGTTLNCDGDSLHVVQHQTGYQGVSLLSQILESVAVGLCEKIGHLNRQEKV